jgi:hypothetical protein
MLFGETRYHLLLPDEIAGPPPAERSLVRIDEATTRLNISLNAWYHQVCGLHHDIFQSVFVQKLG